MTQENQRPQRLIGMLLNNPKFSWGFLVAILVAMPFVIPSTYLAVDILIFGIFVLGFNLIFGHMGLISFGHAMFFGIGAYTTGFILSNLYQGLSVLLLGMILATAVAVAVGYICLKKFGPGSDPAYLALTTLAFSQLFYFICLSPLVEYTGGSDGLFPVPTPVLGIPGLFSFDISKPLSLYFFILAIFLVCIFLMKRIVNSPFGRVIHAIRENEVRVAFLGYNPFRFKLISFTLSGLFGGVAGSLYAIRLNYVGLETFHWLLSGEIILMCLIGGMRTFYGPLVGAAIFLILKDTISAYTQEWMGFIAVIVIGLVLFSPKGIWDRVETAISRISK